MQSGTLGASVLWCTLTVAGALTIGTLAHAQSHANPGTHGALTGDTLFSNDSDHFQEVRTNGGYLFSNGWGLGASFTWYDAPNWSSVYGRGLYGQYHQHTAQQNIGSRRCLSASCDHGHQWRALLRLRKTRARAPNAAGRGRR